MDYVYLFACGLLWSKCGDLGAGWELIAGLQSYDPNLRQLSLEMLARRPSGSQELLRQAFDFGALLPEDGWQAFHFMAARLLAEQEYGRVVMDHRRKSNEFAIRTGSNR